MNNTGTKTAADRVILRGCDVLSKFWGTVSRYRFDYRRRTGTYQSLAREVYDRGDGAAILLYNTAQNTVILTSQMRLPVYLRDGVGDLIEVCAGVLDRNDPETTIRKEVEEETGVIIEAVQEIAAVYTSPGSVTECLHLFVGAYTQAMQTGAGGGLIEEGEEITVLEMPFSEAMDMIDDGRIKDAKTLILLQHAALKGLCTTGLPTGR